MKNTENIVNINLINRIPVCEHGDKDSISIDLINALDSLERALGYELVYNSGYRCEKCNREVGGSENSAHLRGFAVDSSILDSHRRHDLIQAAFELGFRRIGIGKTFVHLDVDISLPQNVTWLY